MLRLARFWRLRLRRFRRAVADDECRADERAAEQHRHGDGLKLIVGDKCAGC